MFFLCHSPIPFYASYESLELATLTENQLQRPDDHLRRNLQGDVVALTDYNGNKVVNYTYDSWGKVVSSTGSLASTLGKDNPIRYRGYYFDEETGLYYLQSRYYDPVTSRFINADGEISNPGNTQGYNAFSYCFNNPISMTDSEGRWPSWNQFWAGVATVAIGVAAVAVVVATGGAATPLVAAGLAAVATAGISCMVYGGLTVAESFGISNPIRRAVGDNVYNSAYQLSTVVASAGTAWVGTSALGGYNNTTSQRTGNGNRATSQPNNSPKVTISQVDSIRIQNAANRTRQTITVVGSRANGTAGLNSDWDYIMSGNSAQRHSAAASVPRGVWGGENNTGIDIFSSYANGPNSVTLDRSKPYIQFFPE